MSHEGLWYLAKMTAHAYIHIPFCLKKCNYCSFVSTSNLKLLDDYLEALKKQIESEYKNEKLQTIYFGGGTPSVLTPKQVSNIAELFNFDEKNEITLEINPESVDFDYFKELKETPINRLSFGFQTFNDEMLKTLGRLHNSQKAVQSVREAQQNGFENISIDLIYGLPSQTLEDVEIDVSKALKLEIQHISLYGLKIEEKTKFALFPPENLPDNDVQADMYEKIVELLTKNGFKHYEISNFALNDSFSKHNLSYWENKNYYGFGLSASGYEGYIRYTNELNLKRYLCDPTSKSFRQELTTREILEEEIFLGLRCEKGVDVKVIEKKFGIDFRKKYGEIVDKYLSTGYLRYDGHRLSLTIKGFLLSNLVMSEFVEC